MVTIRIYSWHFTVHAQWTGDGPSEASPLLIINRPVAAVLTLVSNYAKLPLSKQIQLLVWHAPHVCRKEHTNHPGIG